MSVHDIHAKGFFSVSFTPSRHPMLWTMSQLDIEVNADQSRARTPPHLDKYIQLKAKALSSISKAGTEMYQVFNYIHETALRYHLSHRPM